MYDHFHPVVVRPSSFHPPHWGGMREGLMGMKGSYCSLSVNKTTPPLNSVSEALWWAITRSPCSLEPGESPGKKWHPALTHQSKGAHSLILVQVVMYGYKSWTVKKAEHRRIDAFELWCWRRLLRVPWTARRSNQSILKEISPGSSLEGIMLKLKLQYFGHLMRKVDSLEKTLMLGGIGGRRKRGRQRMRWLDRITDLMDVSLSELRDLVMDRETWRAVIQGVAKSRTRLSNWDDWTDWTKLFFYLFYFHLFKIYSFS